MKKWMYYIPVIGFILALIYWEDLPLDRLSMVLLGPYQGVVTGFPICLLIIYLVYGHL
jgi:hypothetical protein